MQPGLLELVTLNKFALICHQGFTCMESFRINIKTDWVTTWQVQMMACFGFLDWCWDTDCRRKAIAYQRGITLSFQCQVQCQPRQPTSGWECQARGFWKAKIGASLRLFLKELGQWNEWESERPYQRKRRAGMILQPTLAKSKMLLRERWRER